MRRFRARFSVGLLSVALAVGGGTPGCQAVAAALLKLIVNIGTQVAASYVGRLVEEKLDSWFFNKNSSENQGGGDVVATSADALRGRYNGTMEVTVTGDGGRRTTVRVNNPAMVRAAAADPWRLDPAVIQTARQRSEESLGK